MLDHTGHGDGWDGCVVGDDDNYWGPTLDDPNGDDSVAPSERGVQAAEGRQASDQRRAFATMMARSKENVSEILKTVPFAKALEIQEELDDLVRFKLHEPSSSSKTRNPAPAVGKRRPKKKKGPAPVPGAAGNPEGRQDKSRGSKRMRDAFGAGSGQKQKKGKKGDAANGEGEG